MRFARKKVSGVSAILSVVFFYLAAILYVIAFQLFDLGITKDVYELYLLSLTAGTVAIAGCLVCAYLAILLRKTKIFRETYFFIAFVPTFSFLTYIILNHLLLIDVSAQLLILLSIILGTLLSCAFAGYSERELWTRLKRLGLTQGITSFTLIILSLLPIIELSPKVASLAVLSKGTIRQGIFEVGDDMTKVHGQIGESMFTAEVPFRSDTAFVAKQMVNVTNRSSARLDLKICLEYWNGNLSEVRQLEILFTLGNGSEICPFSVHDGTTTYEEVCLRIESHTTVTIGVVSWAQNISPTNIAVVSFSIRFYENKLGMSISIEYR